MQRVPSRELLDDDGGTAAEIRASLKDITTINRYLGGVTTSRRLLERVARRTKRAELSLLEVAAGSGEMPLQLRRQAQAQGIELKVTLLDAQASHMTQGESKVVADALRLPFGENTFDLVSCCLFAHHLSPEQVAEFAREALRCARVAVLINDLVRDPVHWAAALAGRLVYRSRITRNDAPASVRQSYTVDEMREMLDQTPGGSVEVFRTFFYRMGAIVWTGGAADGAYV